MLNDPKRNGQAFEHKMSREKVVNKLPRTWVMTGYKIMLMSFVDVITNC